jgi:hypothetical protein
MNIGRRIYFELSTGNVILDKGEMQGSIVPTTIEQDIENYIVLQERVRESYDYIELPYGQYAQDFHECNGYRINLETRDMEFSYPTGEPNQEPVFRTPLSTQVQELQNQLKTADQKYKELNLETIDLETLKTAKIGQLEENCNQAIVDGFDYTINSVSYKFSCSLEAQANFQGADTLFKDGLITEAEWTVFNNATQKVERVMIEQTTFPSIKLQVFQHINSNISKLRNTLQPQVESATTNLEVDSIVW